MKNEQIQILEKQVRQLRYLVFSLGLVVVAGAAMAFSGITRFTELTAERINIVEKDGTIKLVISNKARQHPGRMAGKDLPPRVRDAGLIFFNGDGDECGGLAYDNDKKSAGMVYSVDKYRDDQVMQIQYIEDLQSRVKKYGLQLWSYGKEDALQERLDRYHALQKLKNDSLMKSGIAAMRKDGLLATERLFIGKTYTDDMGLFIKDQNGKVRIRMYVDKHNQPRIELLDENEKALPLQ
ncbi:hypothetical protein C7T94_08555 [Pedobacter yulinensis]|uniref:Uncharacterized protein n=1 Tax=Pedobacter yulinensis TaxID=2126353 RepID=A0A2T3HJS4_9SPHI|nr:hypothetical protein [Pedobacter yulinensis]PST82698.1 hypothetical protein C7T94_08555 [Pedobacter yulinensis]